MIRVVETSAGTFVIDFWDDEPGCSVFAIGRDGWERSADVVSPSAEWGPTHVARLLAGMGLTETEAETLAEQLLVESDRVMSKPPPFVDPETRVRDVAGLLLVAALTVGVWLLGAVTAVWLIATRVV